MYINNNDEIQNNKKGVNQMNKILSYEEIKQLLKKTKNRVDRYHAAYDELMKLDKDTCQADCRYYGLYKHLWSVFDPDKFNERFEDMKNAELYFNLLNKCAENYDSKECYYYLIYCFVKGIGTPIDDEKTLKSAKAYATARFNPWNLKDAENGEITIGDKKVTYKIRYTYFNRICYESWSSTLFIESYRSLSPQEIEGLGKDYLIDREEIERKIHELQQNS